MKPQETKFEFVYSEMVEKYKFRNVAHIRVPEKY